jgi:hypothetical protein
MTGFQGLDGGDGTGGGVSILLSGCELAAAAAEAAVK